MIASLINKLKALHRDEQGADMVEYILIVAAIALPILAVILIYRNKIYEWVSDAWGNIEGNKDVTVP